MSSFKAFLCSIDGTYNFPLLPKVTTVGRDNCDILINVSFVLFTSSIIHFFTILISQRVQILTHNMRLSNILKVKAAI